MFKRNIRAITIKNNIASYTAKTRECQELSESLRSFSSNTDPTMILYTPSGELFAAYESHALQAPQELSLLDVSGVCMNRVGASIARLLEDAGIKVYATSLCDIAAAFIIDAKNEMAAMKAVREHFILEL